MQHLQDKEFHELAYYTLSLKDECFIHQYIVDAFTAQNANENTKAISLTFSLVGIYLHIEKKYTGKQVQKFHTLMSLHKKIWPNFILPKNKGLVTINSVLKTQEGDERNKMIINWSSCVWNSFYANHAEIKQIAEYYINIQEKS